MKISKHWRKLLGEVWPLPNSNLSFLYYTKSLFSFDGNPPTGIAIKIYRTQEIIDLESVDGKEDMPPFEKRMFFYLDGAELPIIYSSNDGTAYMIIGEVERKVIPVAGASVYGSSPFLLPGKHITKVMIKTKAGKVLEYEWSFVIK